MLRNLFSSGGPSRPEVSSRSMQAMLRPLVKGTVPYATVEEVVDDKRSALLDTRGREEFDVSCIPRARWVGYDTFRVEAVSDIPKDSPIIVYCSVGARSEKVGEKLLAAGYTNVRNLYGGIFEWVNTRRPIVQPPASSTIAGDGGDGTGNAPTKKVHGYNRVWGSLVTGAEVVL